MKKNRFLPGCIVAALFICGVVSAVETNVTAALPVTPPADYGRGFALFYKLGLPDAKGSDYVSLSCRNYANDYSPIDMMYSGRDLGLLGTGWLAKSASTNGSYRFVSGTSELDIYDYKIIQKERKEKMRKMAESAKKDGGRQAGLSLVNAVDKRTSATWKKVNLPDDAKKIIKYLDKQAEEEYGYFSIQQSSGMMFLSAAHMYRNGYTNEANTIVGKLFKTSKDNKKVIISALNMLADAQYLKSVNRFFKNGDWAALQTDLLVQLQRFPKGWQKAPAVKMLYTKVAERIKTAQPSQPVGEGLTEEDFKLAADLAEMKSVGDFSRYYYPSREEGWSDKTLWIMRAPVQPAETNAVAGSVESKAATNVLDRIRERGLKSVPLLLSLLDDDYLVAVNKQIISGSRTYYSYSSGGGEMSEEEIVMKYNNLQRPASRGDIARMLLTSILPTGDDENDFRYIRERQKESASEFRENFIEWYEANKNKNAIELAHIYIEEGGSEQRSKALRFLTKFGGEEDFNLIEKVLLDPDNADDYHYGSLVTDYVGVRGKDAAAFVVQYTNMLAKIASDDEDGMRSWTRRSTKELVNMVSAGSVDDILDSVVSGEKSFDEIINILMKRMWEAKDKTAVYRKLLKLTVTLSDVKETAAALDVLANFGTYGMLGKNSKKSIPPIKDDADIWKKLLADKRPSEMSYYLEETSVGDMASKYIEMIYGGGADRPPFDTVLTTRIYPVLQKRALWRLAGDAEGDLPPLPSALNVADERVEVLIKEFDTTNDVASLAASLSLDELLALWEPFGEHSNLWSKAACAANVITKVKVDKPLVKYLPNLAKEEGIVISEDMLNGVIDATRKMAEENVGALFQLRRMPAFGGVVVFVRSGDTNINPQVPWEYYLRNTDEQNRSYVKVQLSTDNTNLRAGWVVGKAEASVADKVESNTGDDALSDEFDDMLEEDQVYSEEDKQKMMLKEIKRFCAGGDNVFSDASITIVSVPPAKKESE